MTTALIADIGGTNARFALVDVGKGLRPGGDTGKGLRPWRQERVLPCADYTDLASAIGAYLRLLAQDSPTGTPPVIETAAVCVAGPVVGDHLALTNVPWRFSITETEAELGLNRLIVVNDFVANALACPQLGPAEVVAVGGDGGERMARPGFPLAALGPGTGLGVALLVPDPRGGWLPVATEGGHVTLAAETARETAVLDLIGADYGHVSGERVVSGPGLALLYTALRRLDGWEDPGPLPNPIDITEAAQAASDPHAVEALTLFCGFLGSLAGNVVLTTGALGGLYLLGGIVPQILGVLDTSPFRQRFEAKGRFCTYLHPVPTLAVTHPYPAFVGLGGVV